jgi:CDP-paratose 2-epimerase
MGGGRVNSSSNLEAFDMVEKLTGKQMHYEYVDQPRSGDHICYISDLSRFQHHYPKWSVTKSLDDVFRDIIEAWTVRLRE